MATSYRGIFLEPIDQSIQNELKRRSKLEVDRGRNTSFGQGIEENFNNRRSKLAWCKLLSNAQGGGINFIRYKYQLFMGHLSVNATTSDINMEETLINEALSFGFKNNKEDKSGKPTNVNFGDYNLTDRNRPRPGIDKISIINKGGLGSIRQATIDFFVWTEDDLKIMERLYMIPGITCTLEWGWNTYEGNTIHDKYSRMNDAQIGIISKTLDQRDLKTGKFTAGDANQQAGNYDGMIGVITKFNWQVMSNGGYQCQTTLISPNALIGELPTKSSNFNIQRKTVFPEVEGEGGEKSKKEDIVEIYSDIEGILTYIAGADALTATREEESESFFSTLFEEDNKSSWDKILYKFKGLDIFDNSNFNPVSDVYFEQNFEENLLQSYVFKAKEQTEEAGFKGRVYAFNTWIPSDVSVTPTDGSGGTPNNAVWMKVEEVKKASFVSWRFIEDILLPTLKEFKSPKGEEDLFKIKSYNKIRNNKLIRSTDQDICFLPGQHYTENVMEESKIPVEKGERAENRDFGWENTPKIPSLPYPSNSNSFGSRVYTYFKEKQFLVSRFKLDAEGNPPEGEPRDRLSTPLALIFQKELNNITNDYYLDPFRPDSEAATLSEGYIRNIMVNTDFAIKTFNETESVKDFIKTLLDGINKACGSPWDFQLQANPSIPDTLSIVDVNWSKKGTSAFKFTPNTSGSIVKSVSLTSKLPTAIQASAFIGTTRNQPKGGSGETSGWSAYSYGIHDKYAGTDITVESEDKTPIPAGDIDPETGDVVISSSPDGKTPYDEGYKFEDVFDEEDGVGNMKNYLDNRDVPTKKAWTLPKLSIKNNFLWKNWQLGVYAGMGDSLQKETGELLTQYINNKADAEIGTADPTAPNRISPLIPLDLSIGLDGISGIYMGNAITISSVSEGGVLPDRYKNKVAFQVTDVTHTLQNFNWETSINGMMRMTNFQNK